MWRIWCTDAFGGGGACGTGCEADPAAADAAEEEMMTPDAPDYFYKKAGSSQIHLQRQMEQLSRTKGTVCGSIRSICGVSGANAVATGTASADCGCTGTPAAEHKKKIQDRNRLRLYVEQMRRCSPLERLTQGYGLITDESGGRVHSVSQVKEGGC